MTISVLLTIVTTVASGVNVAVASEYSSECRSVMDEIFEGSKEYDFDSFYSMDDNLKTYTIKQNLYDFYVDNELVSSSQYLNTIKRDISLSLPVTTYSSSFDDDISHRGPSITYTVDDLPIYDYDDDEVTIQINGKLDGCVFIGLQFSKDTCIAFYDAIINFFKTFLDPGLFQDIYDISTIVATALMGYSTLAVAFSTIFSAIAGIADTMIAALSGVGGVVSLILALILIIFVTAAIALMVCIFVHGYLKKGFALGWKFKSLFNCEFGYFEL